ncbi:MAG: MarR family winged helix-turn-helix transcriptional regulator [Lachnospiraceae bacterium]|nr:MarR family winged helix-turn-helix transcriptional regulator [Lachnospiraceae bacterium]
MKETGTEIAKIVQMANRLSARVMREEGLGKAEADLVRLVREQPGISQKIAGETLDMDKGAVARRAVNLEKKGYLTRKNNPADARSQLLYPADRAERFRDSDASAEEAFYQWLFATLPEAERAAFYDTVHKLSRSAETESNDGFPNVCDRLGRPALKTENGPENRQRKPAGTAKSRREPDVWLL